MDDSSTITDVLRYVRELRRGKCCPDCGSHVSIRGLHREYWWTCLECDALGIGFTTRAAVLEQLMQ